MIKDILDIQKKSFFDNKISVKERINILKNLKINILNNEEEIYKALKSELGKSSYEAYSSEVSLVIKEIDFFVKKLNCLSKPKRIKNKFPFWFTSKNLIFNEPYGAILIMSPFNYPFQLTFLPLIGAIATGNRSIIKMHDLSIITRKVVKKIIDLCFKSDYIYLIDNENDDVANLFNLDFDFVFFTGGSKVAKIINEKFSSKLIPVVLELGGKCPVIIDTNENLELFVKRILWGKCLNAGQTCIAPDYILIKESIYDQFLNVAKSQLDKILKDFISSDRYSKVVSKPNFDRFINLLKNQKIVGKNAFDETTLKISPTIVEVENVNCPLMQEEVFGPILPVMKYKNISDVFNVINENPNPLAIYLFTYDKKIIDFVFKKTLSGSLVVNDTVFQITKHLPFGGVKHSGNDTYHFKYSYECFTYKRNLVKTSNLNLELRFNPEKISLAKFKKLA